MLDLTGKVAIVTGAGSVGPGWGNGKATATLLARQGASVFLVDINEAAVNARRVRSSRAKARPARCIAAT
jgi:NAD(P)-dependent dehydrogenase (short-subunit alcohol dehydrogenase family)